MLSRIASSRSRGLLQALGSRAASAAASAPSAPAASAPVDPSNPIISPASNPLDQWKNEYYERRGFTLAAKNWTGWDDLPLPYKHLGMKVDPAHVENAGFLWKAMYDWRIAVPAALLVAMPLWMTGNLPGFDERLELSLITILAGTFISREVAPMVKAMQTGPKEAKVKALLDAEAALNDEIARATSVFKSGLAIPETMKAVHAGERALRALEASAATVKSVNAVRDSMQAQLEYLVALQSAASGETGKTVARAARASTEASFEKDAALQQRSIEAAIKALRDGSVVPSDDVVAPAYTAALASSEKEIAARPAANPFKSAAQREIFDKRFGYGADGTRTLAPGVVLRSPFPRA